MRRIGTAIALGTAALAAAPATAAWQQATSRHFIVYADDKEADVRALADRLERFDSVMRVFHDNEEPEEQAANRVTVYVVDGGPEGVGKLCGCRDVAGFYLPRVSGSVAFTPRRIGRGGEYDTDPQIVLFHEYAHHFLLGNYAAAYPAWFSEGYAEFVSTVSFEEDGGAMVGRPAMHRAYGLVQGPPMPIETLFAPESRKLDARQREVLYGRGWLLTHLAMLNPERGRQLRAYLAALNTGRPSVEAARGAFGDLKALDREMNAYLRRSSMSAVKIKAASIKPSAIEVRALTPGESAMVAMRMRSDAGVDAKSAAALFARAAPVAARFPADATVQGWFAEIAYDAGQEVDAEAAADRAIAADPRSSQGLLYKGQIRLRRAARAHATDPAQWKEARSWIVRANKLNPYEAEPLVLYYNSFGLAHETPPPLAVRGLDRALELVPQDPGLRVAAARQAMRDRRLAAARAALRPVAFSPHAGEDNPARRLLELLDTPAAAEAVVAAAGDDAGE